LQKILVVDDDQMLREAYALMLSSHGYVVATAVDGLDALKQCSLEKPDLILLDMMMPNLDGVGFLKQLDLASGKKDVKVIIFSNVTSAEKINEALVLGALKHITKSSMTPQQLITEIDHLLVASR
jgi:CheY-like chemotaxis protein